MSQNASGEDATAVEDAVRDAPPSAKLVYKVLQYNGALTQKEIVEKSMLSQRTVRDAIDRLQDLEVVTEQVYIPDARQSLYELDVSKAENGTEPTAPATSLD